jgi:DNA-binding MarR family transcriptional regulator
MTRIVTSLAAAHLVTRESHPDDARATLITATDAGRSLLIEGRRRRVGVLEQRISELSTTERDTLERALDALERVSRGVT